MLDFVANKFFKGNKNVAFIVLASTGLVLIILIVILIANLFSWGIKDYTGLEKELVKATEKYYEDNEERLPKTDGEIVSVSSDMLVEGKYIKELDKLYSKDTCSATVELIKSGEEYLYNPILDCENYKSKTLVDELTSKVVTEESGLYKENEEYIFRGEYVNNYVKFDNKLWRIVKIDGNGIKMYLIYEKLEKVVWDDRYNLEKKDYYGKNTYDTSRISTYLKNAYNDDTFVSSESKKYLVNAEWCIGSIKEKTPISNINLCNETIRSYIGLLGVDDYAKASLEPACKNFDDAACVNYNYLLRLNNTNWTLNSYPGNTYDVYAITSSGVEINRASREKAIRPVIYLNSHVLLSSGDGSEESPYTIK